MKQIPTFYNVNLFQQLVCSLFGRYVQSRGRARAEHSHFIMMLESGRPAAAFKSKELREFQELDLVMKNHCYDRISPTVEERIKGFADEEYPPFQPSGCNALISMDTALPTLQRYSCLKRKLSSSATIDISPFHLQVLQHSAQRQHDVLLDLHGRTKAGK